MICDVISDVLKVIYKFTACDQSFLAGSKILYFHLPCGQFVSAHYHHVSAAGSYCVVDLLAELFGAELAHAGNGRIYKAVGNRLVFGERHVGEARYQNLDTVG